EVRYLGAEALHGRIHQAVAQFVRAHALVQPLALVWDDLHWADPSSLKVLDVLLPLCAEVPMLLVLVFRADEPRVSRFQHESARIYGDHYHAIELDALGHADSARLLNSLLRVEHWPEETRSLILDKAEGNPFYLEEILRTLIDSGVVVLRGNQAILVRAAETIHVPDTLHGVIMARIDRLAAVDRRILQTAAVIGRVFSYQVLARLLEPEIGTEQLEQSLRELHRRDFVRPRDAGAAPGPVREYSFRHAMTHEATYHSLLIARRQELHRRAGEAIEALFPDQVDELAPTLGYHFERAELRDKAIRYFVQAGDHARAIYANAEASAFYRAALEQVRRLPATAPVVETQLSERLGDVLLLRGQYDEAGGAYEGASGVIALHDPVWQARLHRKAGKVREAQRRYDEASRAYDLAEAALGAEPGEPDLRWGQEWIQIQLERLWLHYWLAQWQEMGEFAEQLRPVVERFGLPVQRAAFFIQIVNLNLRRDRYVVSAATLAYCEAAVYASEEADDLDAMTWARFALGGSRLFHGDIDEGEAQLQTALALAERSGDIAHQARCWTYLTLIARKRGQVDAARQAGARSLELATAGQMLEYIAMAQANEGWLAWRLGDRQAAQEQAEAALELWRQISLVYPL
ncbi:MAG TPA: hypothetical protein VEZ12_07275, partial [Herpetosiphonaceae bacterium]|nr:hypothetical protein [Herpetosiphonaceae bacterium]